MKSKILRGVPASPGIAMGKAYVLKKPYLVFSGGSKGVEEEMEVFLEAIRKTKEELSGIKEGLSGDAVGIIEVQEAILEDPLFRERVETKIKDGKGAHESILEFLDEIKREFGSLGDRYLKERYLDIKDVSHRILHHIFPRRIEWQPEEPHILIAHDLTPSETAQLNKDRVLGFATDAGGRTSHTAIVARSL
ncbi:phosphoenolpyruvate--protein phosphotransferase, partial [bacterium]